MTYTAPTTYSTGDAYNATEANNRGGNHVHFYDRVVSLSVPAFSTITPTAVGDWLGYGVSNAGAGTQHVYFPWHVPDDFRTLVSWEIVVVATTGHTMEYDLNSDYGNPDTPENYNTNSGSNLNQTLALTSNRLHLISLNQGDVLTNIAAGDFISAKISNSAGGAGTWYVLGSRVMYRQS